MIKAITKREINRIWKEYPDFETRWKKVEEVISQRLKKMKPVSKRYQQLRARWKQEYLSLPEEEKQKFRKYADWTEDQLKKLGRKERWQFYSWRHEQTQKRLKAKIELCKSLKKVLSGLKNSLTKRKENLNLTLKKLEHQKKEGLPSMSESEN